MKLNTLYIEMRPPKILKPYVVSFIRDVVNDSEVNPIYVGCDPVKHAPQNECFQVVQNYIEQNGGTAVIGWAIWERPKVFIEAEFHTIWRAPDGRYLDISPRQRPVPRILFIQDNRRKYEYVQVDNVRKSLTKDKDVERFLFLRREYFKLVNEGDLKHQFGLIPATPKIRANIYEAMDLEQKLNKRYGPWLPEE